MGAKGVYKCNKTPNPPVWGKESSILPGVYRGNAIKFASGLVSYIEAQTNGIATVPFR